jgi:hypothetical protein
MPSSRQEECRTLDSMPLSLRTARIGLLVLCGAAGGCTATTQVAVSGSNGAACVQACRSRAGSRVRGKSGTFADCVEECPGGRMSDCRPNGTTCVAIERTSWPAILAGAGLVVAVAAVVVYGAALDSLSE